MDLNFYDREDLEAAFLEHYLLQNPCIITDEDQQIFQFYKLYRANVRLKVEAFKASQATDAQEWKKRFALVEDYFLLLKKYLSMSPGISYPATPKY